MRYYPFFMDMRGRRVVVVGGGETAAQKLRLLLKSEATIEVVAEAANAEIAALADDGRVTHRRALFSPEHIRGALAVFAATEDEAADQAVAIAAQDQGLPVNVVDRQDLCSFITPAIVDRDPVTIAITTEGAAPVLGQRVRAQIEAMLPMGLGALATFAAGLRGRVADALADGAARRRFWTSLFDGRIAERFLAGDRAADLVDWELSKPAHGRERAGLVALVGAGPGSADLLTLRAQRWLRRADVLVIDRLVGDGVIELARRDARRIYVGKTPGGPTTPQPEINRIIVEEALAGRTVVRLKGGDPMVFGRASEELAACAEAGIETLIVPGVTAAIAGAAEARIPLTQREENRSLTLFTGRAADGVAEQDWAALARGGASAVYMGVGAVGHIQSRLLDAGLSAETPITIVEKAERPDRRTLIGHIGGLSELIADEHVLGPAIIYIGAHPLPGADARGEIAPIPTRIETPAPLAAAMGA